MTTKRIAHVVHHPDSRNFLDKHLGSVLMVICLACSFVAGYGILQARVSTLESVARDHITTSQYLEMARRIALIEADGVRRSEHEDSLRRVSELEKQLVPRSEHELREVELNKRLDAIRDDIKMLQMKIDNFDVKHRS